MVGGILAGQSVGSPLFDEITLVGWWDLLGWWIPSLLVGEIPLVHGILVCWLVGSTLVAGIPVV